MATLPPDARILIVDDDDVDRERARRALARLGSGLGIEEASDAEDALARAVAGGIDCVLLDYRLGAVNGLDLLPRIARDRPETAVVLLTGIGDERVAVEAMKLGASDYLRKRDLSPEVLEVSIGGAMERTRLRQALVDAHADLERMSLYDGLTGLPNRNLFLDRLRQSVLRNGREGSGFAVLMIDLDGFKQVNDSHGHHVGDAVLVHVASQLGPALRRSDTVARLGGDEFAAILPGVTDPGDAAAAARKVCAAAAEPLLVEGDFVSVGLSVGVALCPEHAADADVLLRRADGAMYRAKRSGGGVELASSDDEGERASPLAGDLAAAIDGDQLVLHFQPKVDLATGAPVEAEALVRWHHPDLGLLPPLEFVPLAERSSIIGDLTWHVIAGALDAACAWRDAGTPLPVAVNLSPTLLHDESLTARVASALAARGLAPDTLTLEITETGLMASPARAARIVADLAAAGVGISIDDFGIGYTSLRYLREFAVSEIKIDRVFTDDLRAGSRDATIVHSIVELGRGFGVRVVAEGIEDRAIHDALVRLGCGHGQGYAVARPMDGAAFAEWLRDATDARPPAATAAPEPRGGARRSPAPPRPPSPTVRDGVARPAVRAAVASRDQGRRTGLSRRAARGRSERRR